MKRQLYSIDYPPRIDAGLGELQKGSDYPTYVRQLMKQVLLTNPGERINRPDFGAGLRRQVFAPSSQTTATLLQTIVFQSLDRWLGDLIAVQEVNASFDDGRLDVGIVYVLKARGERQVLNLEVTA